MIKRILLVVALWILGAALFIRDQRIKYPVEVKGIVRLHDFLTGHFFCTGTVISKDIVLTAAHCVVGRPQFINTIVVRGAGVKAGASVINYDERSDRAMLRGNFSQFEPMQVESDPAILENIFRNKESRLITCGYPYAGKLVCTPVRDLKKENFFILGRSFLYPGMSGGPVIDVATGKIVATNTAVEGEFCVFAPMAEVFVGLGIESEI